jgi:phage FluMu protein Com
MARISYETGLKCKRCGKIVLSVSRLHSRVLCQGCGAHIVDIDFKTKEGTMTENSEKVTVKVTHKLFSDIYEEV